MENGTLRDELENGRGRVRLGHPLLCHIFVSSFFSVSSISAVSLSENKRKKGGETLIERFRGGHWAQGGGGRNFTSFLRFSGHFLIQQNELFSTA